MFRPICRSLKAAIAPSRVRYQHQLRPLSSRFPKPASGAGSITPVSVFMLEEQSVEELSLYSPPPGVRGMTHLDRDAFSRKINVPALRVTKEALQKVVKALKKVTLKRCGLKRVMEDPDGSDSHKLVLLDPASISSPSSLGEVESRALQELGVSVDIRRHELCLTYENLKVEEVLRAVLLEGQDVTSGFSRVGHIAHLNLRDHQLPYRHLIGQVLMDKNSGVTCVVNKTNTIDSTFRNFQMEVLAGDGNMVAKVRENGFWYEFDFSQVYWNPRLSTEHERLVSLFKPRDTVVDVFAGVGPFAIPAAKRGCSVLANDLNPESHRWLLHNCRLNKVESRVQAFNLDGRAFIQGPLHERLPALLKGPGATHIVMNLPALALEFLDAFHGLLDAEPGEDASALPWVHCYGFSKQDDPREDMVDRASASLGVALEGRCSVHMVRNVAPNKEMMCVSFSLPREALFSSHRAEEDTHEEPDTKRQRRE